MSPERRVGYAEFDRRCGDWLRTDQRYEHGRWAHVSPSGEIHHFLYEADWWDDLTPGVIIRWPAGTVCVRTEEGWRETRTGLPCHPHRLPLNRAVLLYDPRWPDGRKP